ncbi:retrovirus-related Pol polyprotein from transposon 17.6 [Elysia marginata]|uniref:Retrovirus-related Pol polyprotein from transposon 17.6 n=1 Tax=Elysia marginata TaxID=1093978 RepID=A0AAV4GWY0_9GAST|nr:retrovirus-related Pol polyprotein from transposon 17.6 [Elysia marginata]
MNRQPEEEVPLNVSDTARSVGRLAKLSEAVNISPCTTMNVSVTGCDLNYAGEVFVESLEFPLHGCDGDALCGPCGQGACRCMPHQRGRGSSNLEATNAADIMPPFINLQVTSCGMEIVQKKDGSIRPCVDYRKLNAITRRDAFPLPRIDESLDAIGGASFFSTLDLASGYQQVAMHEEDQEKTAFTTPFGLWEFTTMPFGLSGAPATFQRLMQSSMNDLVQRILLVYLDDVLKFSSDFDEHLKRLDTVFERLREIGLKRNPDKCRFGAR